MKKLAVNSILFHFQGSKTVKQNCEMKQNWVKQNWVGTEVCIIFLNISIYIYTNKNLLLWLWVGEAGDTAEVDPGAVVLSEEADVDRRPEQIVT